MALKCSCYQRKEDIWVTPGWWNQWRRNRVCGNTGTVRSSEDFGGWWEKSSKMPLLSCLAVTLCSLSLFLLSCSSQTVSLKYGGERDKSFIPRRTKSWRDKERGRLSLRLTEDLGQVALAAIRWKRLQQS